MIVGMFVDGGPESLSQYCIVVHSFDFHRDFPLDQEFDHIGPAARCGIMKTAEACFHPGVGIDTVVQQVFRNFYAAEHAGARECFGKCVRLAVEFALVKPVDNLPIKCIGSAKQIFESRKIAFIQMVQCRLPQFVHSRSLLFDRALKAKLVSIQVEYVESFHYMIRGLGRF